MKRTIINPNKKMDIGIVIYIFIFLFEPPFIPKMRGLIYLSLYSCIMIMCRYKKTYKSVWKMSGMTTWIFSLSFFFLYSIVPVYISIVCFNDVVQFGHYIHTYVRYFILIISILCCSTYIILECDRKKYTIEDLIRVILYAGILQGICAICALLIPEVKDLFVKMMSTGNEADSYFYSLRAYGFSKNMVDGFGLGTGIIAGLSCILGRRDKRYIILSVFLLLVPLLNSRTGLIIYMIAIGIYILGLLWDHKVFEIIKIAVIVGSCVVIALQFYQFLSTYKPELVAWVNSGLDGFFSVVQGEKANGGSMAVLMKDSWWKLPDGIRFFIGTGHTRYGAEGYLHTDVGYVNDIWFVGIVGSILLYSSILLIFYKAFNKIKDKNGKLVLLFLLISLVVFNVKTCAISYYPGTAIIFTLVFMYIYRGKEFN